MIRKVFFFWFLFFNAQETSINSEQGKNQILFKKNINVNNEEASLAYSLENPILMVLNNLSIFPFIMPAFFYSYPNYYNRLEKAQKKRSEIFKMFIFEVFASYYSVKYLENYYRLLYIPMFIALFFTQDCFVKILEKNKEILNGIEKSESIKNAREEMKKDYKKYFFGALDFLDNENSSSLQNCFSFFNLVFFSLMIGLRYFAFMKDFSKNFFLFFICITSLCLFFSFECEKEKFESDYLFSIFGSYFFFYLVFALNVSSVSNFILEKGKKNFIESQLVN